MEARSKRSKGRTRTAGTCGGIVGSSAAKIATFSLHSHRLTPVADSLSPRPVLQAAFQRLYNNGAQR